MSNVQTRARRDATRPAMTCARVANDSTTASLLPYTRARPTHLRAKPMTLHIPVSPQLPQGRRDASSENADISYSQFGPTGPRTARKLQLCILGFLQLWLTCIIVDHRPSATTDVGECIFERAIACSKEASSVCNLSIRSTRRGARAPTPAPPSAPAPMMPPYEKPHRA